MKKSLLALLLVLSASAASASIAPPCDKATFEGQSSCGGDYELTVGAPPPPPVPEPSTLALIASGLAAVVIAKRKRLG